MNIFSKIWARTFQTIFKCLIPLMPYREPEILSSVMDIKKVLNGANLIHPLIITDESLTKLKLYNPLVKDLKDNNVKVTIYDEIVPNPTIENVEEAYKLYLDKKCDCIIAFGGGSVIDAAKITGARVANPQKSVEKMKGLLKVKGPLPTLIAIPTTAGTGSETTVAGVISDHQKQTKYAINDFDLIPKYAVLDEKLTLGLPKSLTATTGMDALTHAIEAYIGNSTTKLTKHYALEACRLIFENLQKAYDDGNNERARKHMLKASYMAGISFTISYVGYVHAIAHSLGGKYNTPHGLANAVILPYILGEYGKTIYKKLKEIAVYTNIARPYDSDTIASNKLINKILELNEHMGIPKKFDFIVAEDIPELAKHASHESYPLYPVPKLMCARELEKIYYNIKA